MTLKKYTLPCYEELNSFMSVVHLSDVMLRDSKRVVTDGVNIWIFFSDLDEFIRCFPNVVFRLLGDVLDHSNSLMLDLLEIKFPGTGKSLGNLFVTSRQDCYKEIFPFVCLEYTYNQGNVTLAAESDVVDYDFNNDFIVNNLYNKSTN